MVTVWRGTNVRMLFYSLQYPKTASEVLVADHHSKFKMTFDLINQETKDKVTLHQVLN